MSSALQHLGAFAVAFILCFGLRVQSWNIAPLAGVIEGRAIRSYTPYFPGLASISQHEIFSPKYESKKKIVLLGASAIDSIGCDLTWEQEDLGRSPSRNAHYSCSIAFQMTKQLHAAGYADWEAFDLARNGAKMTSMLFVYARILALKPNIVIFGDTFPYYMQDNADAENLTQHEYAILNATFDHGATKDLWRSYRSQLVAHGADARVYQTGTLPSEEHRGISLNDLVSYALRETRQAYSNDVPPLPIEIAHRKWQPQPGHPATFVNPDPGFRYFQAMELIALKQREFGGKMLFYFSPQFEYRKDAIYNAGLDRDFGGYLAAHGISYENHVALPLKTDLETFDGVHQTLYGNRVLARVLLKDLEKHRLISKSFP